MSVWDDIDKLKKEHDELALWLKEEEGGHGSWTLQDASPDGQYVVMRRASREREREYLRAKTTEGIKQAIVDFEKREHELEEEHKKIPALQGWRSGE